MLFSTITVHHVSSVTTTMKSKSTSSWYLSLLLLLIVCSLQHNPIMWVYADDDENTSSSSSSSSFSICNEVIETDVIIIGAGLSGIMAYQELTNYNKNMATKVEDPTLRIKMLEASNRMGGRIKTEKVQFASSSPTSATIEFGANWFHNEGSPLW